MPKIYTTENITANQRAWYEQKFKPSKCKECKKPIVFMKNIHWNYVPCDAVKKIIGENEGDMKIMQEDGIISTMGRRVGWPVHVCVKQSGDSADRKAAGVVTKNAEQSSTASQPPRGPGQSPLF